MNEQKSPKPMTVKFLEVRNLLARRFCEKSIITLLN